MSFAFGNLLYMILSINTINSDCDFQVLRFKRKDINCYDRGVNKLYCKSNIIAKEFTIKKELGVGNKVNYIIKPQAMYEEINNVEYKIADFQYFFYCDNNYNLPKLSLNIYPTPNYDKSYKDEFLQFATLMFIILLVFIICGVFGCKPNNSNNNFCLGYVLGSNNSRRRAYCE